MGIYTAIQKPVDNQPIIDKIKGHHWWPWGSRRYTTKKPVMARVRVSDNENWVVRINKNITWDGPTWYPIFNSRKSMMLAASVFHDMLYLTSDHNRFQNNDITVMKENVSTGESSKIETWTRDEADVFFKKHLLELGRAKLLANLIDIPIDLLGKFFSKNW